MYHTKINVDSNYLIYYLCGTTTRVLNVIPSKFQWFFVLLNVVSVHGFASASDEAFLIGDEQA